MRPIRKIAKNYGLKVIEDACQAHGATYEHKKAGSLGDLGCFSFHHSKNLGGFGNGGAVVTSNKKYFDRILVLRNPESNEDLLRQSKRTPAYLDAVQIAFIKAKMEHLARWIESRRKIAEYYHEHLKKEGIELPKEAENCRHTFRSYCILTKRRGLLKHYLLMRGVEARIQYSLPIHLTKTFEYLGYGRGSFPAAEYVSKNALCLPIHPLLTHNEIKYVADAVAGFCRLLH